MPIYKDREEAGKRLAKKLIKYKNNPDVVVLGLPRGGIITAEAIAKELKSPLDIIVARKIGAPSNEELAIGAICECGKGLYNNDLMKSLDMPLGYLDKTVIKEKKEAQRRLKKYRGKKPKIDLKNKIAILVDDGIATGYTMYSAIISVKCRGVRQIVVAVPVLPKDTLKKLKQQVTEVVYLDTPIYFGAVGQFYKNFDQTEDEEVINILNKY
jgi:predicted phosphoribosyltransferase